MPSQTQLALAVVAGGATVAAILYYLRRRSEATPAGHVAEGVIKEVYRTSLQRQATGQELRACDYDCFLSHKRSDCQDIVARVYDRLTDAGYRVFIDREELEELPKLKGSVLASRRLVFFLSPKIFESSWCAPAQLRRNS